MSTCPNCGAQNDAANRFCDQCGTRLGGETTAPAGAVSPDQPTMAAPNCPSCGATVLPGEAFCDNCGADLSGIATTPSAMPPVAADAPTMLAVPASGEPAPTAAANQPTCRVCGATVLPGERFCDNCGADLQAPAAEAAPAPTPAAATVDSAAAPDPAQPADNGEETMMAPIETSPPSPEAAPVTANDETVIAPIETSPPADVAETAPPAPAPEETAAPAAAPQAAEETAAPAAAPQAEEATPQVASTDSGDPARKAELEAEIARQQQIITQFEQMQATFGAATPPAVVTGLDEARQALTAAESELATLAPAAPAIDPAEVQRLQDEIARQQQIITQFEQMQATFGAATPPAVTSGLADARTALSAAEAELAALGGGNASVAAPAAPAAPAGQPEAASATPADAAPPAAPASAGARFVFEGGQVITLPTDRAEIVIGREDPVSNIFPEVDLTPHGGETGGVSRQHAKITRSTDQWMLTDLNSTNYTRVNGTRLEPNTATAISSGAKLQFGRVAVTFEL